MRRSESIVNLVKALSAAQAVMGHAVKSTKNEFFRSNYADLAEVWNAIRAPLTDSGLCVIQTFDSAIVQVIDEQRPEGQKEGPPSATVTVVTTLCHVSGEWVESTISMPVMLSRASKEDPRLVHTPQAYGSATTYARRYSLAAIVGLSQDDDDGNSASQNPKVPPNTRVGAAEKAMTTRQEVLDVIAAFSELKTADAVRKRYNEYKEKEHEPPLNQQELRALHTAGAKRAKAISDEAMKPENEDQRPKVDEETGEISPDVPQ